MLATPSFLNAIHAVSATSFGTSYPDYCKYLNAAIAISEAIVCANDGMAIAAFKYLQQSGYEVRKDVALTGMDGIHGNGACTDDHNIAS